MQTTVVLEMNRHGAMLQMVYPYTDSVQSEVKLVPVTVTFIPAVQSAVLVAFTFTAQPCTEVTVKPL